MRQVPNTKEDEKMERNIYRRLALISFAALSILLLVPTQAEAAVLDPPGRSSTDIDPRGDNHGAPSFLDLRMAVISQHPNPSTVELSMMVDGAFPATPPADTCFAVAWLIDADKNAATGAAVNDIGVDFAIVVFGIGSFNTCGIASTPVGVYSAFLTFPGSARLPMPLPNFSVSNRAVEIITPLPFSTPPGATFFWVAVSANFQSSCATMGRFGFCDIAPDTGHVTHTAI